MTDDNWPDEMGAYCLTCGCDCDRGGCLCDCCCWRARKGGIRW